MNNIISVWGSPNSGKTTLATKLALHYLLQDVKVAIVYCDNLSPALPVIFPNWKQDELYSIGSILEQEEIIDDFVYKNAVTTKKYPGLIALGYKDAENKFSYPRLTSYKVTELIHALRNIVDCIIFDCSSDLEDILSSSAIQHSDAIVRCYAPDLKSLSWSTSQMGIYGTSSYNIDKHIVCINNVSSDISSPTEEIKSFLKTSTIEFPYCQHLKMQMATGDLLNKQSVRQFDKPFIDLLISIEDLFMKTGAEEATGEDSNENSEFGILEENNSSASLDLTK